MAEIIRMTAYSQRIRPPIDLVVTHCWKK